MCGIAGIIGPPAAETAAIVDLQLAALHHRGPDAQGRFGSRNGVIGAARLSIIDLETGDPPITNETGSIGVALNGEIYNYRALTIDLRDRGHEFGSTGDTEVIAHLAEELLAVELARQLDGMFAFAVWDEERQRLVLGRDHLGRKPLYWWYRDGRLVFGSEIKALLADPTVARELNPRAIPAYLTFGYVPSPDTFYGGIHSLPPAHVLTFTPGEEPQVERYWDLALPGVNDVRPLAVGMTEATGIVRPLLEAAVERRLVADVPLGAFLSGGVDSSAVVALMARLSDAPVRTFTIGFEDEQGFDERPYARLVAERYSTDHHEHVVRPDAVELIDTLLWHHDQPFGDSSAIPFYLVSRETRRDVTVALTGDGGDELFAGYERFAAALTVDRYHYVPRPLRHALRTCLGVLPPDAAKRRAESIQRYIRHADKDALDASRSWLSFLDEDARHDAVPGADGWALVDYAASWSHSKGSDLLTRLLDLNLRTYLLDDLLVKADRMSMANGLEVRSPFLDIDLLELSFRLPSRLKLWGFERKRVLRQAVADLLPREILERRKRGFAVPLDSWFRGDLGRYLEARLGSPDSRVKQHLRAEFVDRLIAEQAGGQRNHGQALWMLLTLELFLRREDW
jgi:asparagine synthase (glutamine-hydrolysing)